MSQVKLVEHIFRHEYGLLVASLVRRVGTLHLDAVEDAVQFAMMQALEFWVRQRPPENPNAWLYKVAYRKLLTELRKDQRQCRILYEQWVPSAAGDADQSVEPPLEGEMTDALLRMLFVTCNDAIPTESQLVFTLKSLCGFNVNEIAQRLFISEANVYKRFSRARHLLQQLPLPIEQLSDIEISARLSGVHQILYLVFTEGYLSSHCDLAIRRDLCEEAIRLTVLLSESRLGKQPATYALLALMYLHLSRFSTRQDSVGALILLEEQDRTEWDQLLITMGLECLQQSANGDQLTRYHIEAGIAAEHCMATSFEQTRWDRIVEAYELLGRISPSPMMHLNKAIALAEWQGAEVALQSLQSFKLPAWLEKSYYWHAVQADLLERCGEFESALQSAHRAMRLAPTEQIKKLLVKRLAFS